jgi:hypothetical protein
MTFICCAVLTMTTASVASPLLCYEVAREIKARLRALPANPSRPGDPGLSIRAALAGSDARLDLGAPVTAAALAEFPFTDSERDQLRDAAVRVARAGGARGLVLVDGASGTAHCHTPYLFSLASGEKRGIAVPAPHDPFDRCGHGGIALVEVSGSAYFVETNGGAEDSERIRIFPQQGDVLGMVCSITARYGMEFAVAESFCAKPDLCRLAPKAAVWARSWRTGSAELRDPAFSPLEPPKFVNGDPALPLAEAAAPPASQAFSFDAEQSWFAILGEPEADRLRIGAAKPDPANMADWGTFTLVALYKSDRPVAGFVIIRRRSAVESVEVNPD